ncbi:MAG: family hydrolase, diadenosine tetraphosphate hydrolase [Verrucomicrobiales bacterium]|nr:family hydrolase, diadenosine tetraphosphate hydrolase [Verrucomicrobiales bacterium]
MSGFELHPRLAAGSFLVGRTADCLVLLKDNAAFPWFVIVPEVAEGIEDLHQLEPDRYGQVLEVARQVSIFVSGYFKPEKLNVACIGNQVRQMHLHVVGRRVEDAAWPGTVWASAVKEPWDAAAVQRIMEAARGALDFDSDSDARSER